MAKQRKLRLYLEILQSTLFKKYTATFGNMAKRSSMASMPLDSPRRFKIEPDNKRRIEILHDTIERFQRNGDMYKRLARENMERWAAAVCGAASLECKCNFGKGCKILGIEHRGKIYCHSKGLCL